MNLLFWTVFSLSILCLLYYCLIIAYAGLRASFSEAWMIAGLTGIFLCLVIRYMKIHNIETAGVIRILLILLAVAGLLIFTLIEGLLIFHSGHKTIKQADFLLILGAQVRGTTISKTLLKRLDTAFAYLQKNQETIAVVSGGKGEGEAVSEAEAMMQYLVQRGIAASRIIKEDKSRNTYENILYSKPLIREKSSVAIVTNGFHVYRSTRLARKQGMTGIQAIAAPTDRLLAVNYYVREAVGVLKDLILGNI